MPNRNQDSEKRGERVLYGVFHRRHFLWGLLVALLCLLLPLLGGVVAQKAAQRAHENLPAEAVMGEMAEPVGRETAAV